MEIVKGQFYGIGPDQLALVSWHSETSGPDIEYTTNLISNHRKMFVEGNKIWLTNQHNDNESVKEFFIYESGQLTDYIFQFQRKNKEGEILLRNFHFKIFLTDRNKVKDFKLSYPDK